MATINEIVAKQAIEGLLKTDKLITSVGNNALKTVEKIESLNKSLNDSGITLKKAQTIQKESAKQDEKLIKLKEKAIKAEEKQRIATEKAGKAVLKRVGQSTLYTKALVKEGKELTKTQEKEKAFQKALNLTVKSEQDLITKTNALVRMRKLLDQTTESGRKKHAALTQEINKNTLALKKSDAAINRNQRNVGKYSTAIQGLGGQFLGALGLTSLVFSFISVLKNGFSTIFQFGQANATLAATLGKTREEIEPLTEAAIDYGKATKFTATEVSRLQNELAKLGFTAGEIDIMTRSVLNLAEATGGDLSASAKATGIALKVFGLSALEADEVTASLAISTTKSALAFEDFETILSNMGPVAKAYGFSLEDALAFTAKLRDAGFDASKSSTAFRNILLNLADASGDLAVKLGGNVTSIEGLIPALSKLRSQGVSLNETLQITDKRSVAAFNSLLDGADDVLELRDSITDVNDELEEMVTVKTDNVIDATARMGSAWDGVVLTFKESEGFFVSFFDNISDGLNVVSDNYASFGEKTIGLFGGLFGGITGISKEAVLAQIKARKSLFNFVRESGLKELADLRVNYAQQARDGDEFSKDLVRRIDAQIVAIADSNRKAAKREADAKAAGLAAIEEAQQKAEDRRLKKVASAEEKRASIIEAARRGMINKLRKIEEDGAIGTDINNIETLAKEIEAELDLEIAAADKETDIWAEAEDKKTKNAEEEAQKRLKLDQDIAAAKKELLIEGTNALFDIYQNNIDRELNALDKQREYQLASAEGNEAEQEKINAKFDAKEIELKKKQDRAERAQTLFNIALSTTLAVAQASPNLPLMILAGALGAVQAAVVASTPLPQYWTGIDSVPTDGNVIVGDRGRELIKKDNKLMIANEPTIASGLKGAKVWNNKETEMILSGKNVGYDSPDLRELIQGNKDIVRAINKNGAKSYTESANRTITERGTNYTKKYLNRKLR